VPGILTLLEALPDGDAFGSLDAGRRRIAIDEAVKRLLLRETQRQPVLLLLENLHWIDAESRGWLDRLVDSLPSARLLLLVSYRPEFEHGWSNRSYYTQLRLDPLPPRNADELLGALLGRDPGLEPLRSLLMKRTGGNPLFLEESVRTLLETNALEGERGAYRLARALHAVQVPATIQALLAARIDRLAPDDKRLLQAASVIGTDVPFPLLQALAERPDEDLRRGLARLQAAELLSERTIFPEPEYTFRHALTHEVAYGSLLHDQRRALHARIVTAIETLYPDRLAEWRDRLAHHVVRGEVWHKALVYFRPTSGTNSPILEGSPWWIGEYGRSLEQGEADVAAGFDLQQQVIGHFQVGQVHHARGDYAQAADHLRRNVAGLEGDLARERFGLPAVASVLSQVWLAWCLAETGEILEAEALGRQARATAEAAGDTAGRILAGSALGLALLARGDRAAAGSALDSALTLARGTPSASLVPFVAAPLGRVQALTGRHREALALLVEADERADAAGLVAGHALRLAWRAEADLLAGRPEAAVHAERALALALDRGERGDQAHALRVRAEVRAGAGDDGGAEAGYREARQLAAALGMRPLDGWCRLGLGTLYRRLGRREEARTELAAALAGFSALAMEEARARAAAELGDVARPPGHARGDRPEDTGAR
jgi:tetratricopeptide (TPR) repeat protein